MFDEFLCCKRTATKLDRMHFDVTLTHLRIMFIDFSPIEQNSKERKVKHLLSLKLVQSQNSFSVDIELLICPPPVDCSKTRIQTTKKGTTLSK